MIFNGTEEQEKEYLQQVIDIINDTINSTDKSVKEHVDTLQEYKDYLWSNKDIDPHEIRSMRESILNHFARGENVIDKRNRLSKILDIPYFGRIDFKENKSDSKNIPIYIGIHTFFDIKSKRNLIYDWRAPISGMFYDYESDEATYSSPSGEVHGKISLKRQYRIRKGKMEYMIESSVTVHDDILQKELCSNADDKMRNIVTTIQREQNRIIRNEDTPVLIIQGVAGSGKTSIALHRIAYLLYAQKGKIASRDILIISPNKVFADYISNVLPELGETTVPETSMEQILSTVLNNKYKYQDFFGQVSELLEKPVPDFIERIQYKASFEFVSRLDKFILHMENHYFKATNVKITKYITIPAEKNLLRKEIKNMFSGNNDLQIYKDFFEWAGKPEMFKMRKNRMLEYADMAPLAYLHLALDGNKTQTHIRHLLIDEMQDYSPIQYKVIQKLYPCRKTILGDASQSVNPYGSSTAAMIQKVFITGEIMKLCKSYRSTFEITCLAQKIQTNKELEPIMRHGEQPEILQFKNTEEETTGIANLISDFRNSGYTSLGIICKTETLAKALAQKLQVHTDNISLLSSQSSAYTKGVVVTSAHMAKGLEFDEVIIPQADNKNYHSTIDSNMLYVAVTRAMHKITLTYSGIQNQFIG